MTQRSADSNMCGYARGILSSVSRVVFYSKWYFQIISIMWSQSLSINTYSSIILIFLLHDIESWIALHSWKSLKSIHNLVLDPNHKTSSNQNRDLDIIDHKFSTSSNIQIPLVTSNWTNSIVCPYTHNYHLITETNRKVIST